MVRLLARAILIVLGVLPFTGCAGGSSSNSASEGSSTTPPPGAIILNSGENVQNVVRANPAGSIYYFNPGVYRMQSISPKTGDTYMGAPGADLNGSQLLTSWTQVTINGKIYWTTAGGKPSATVNSFDTTKCETAFPGCYYPQNLYFNNADYTHVVSLSQVTAGNWYYEFQGLQTASIVNPGSSYVVGDVLTVVDTVGTQGQVTVTSVNTTGGVTGLQINAFGYNYPASATELTSGGSGTGCTVSITAGSGGITNNIYLTDNPTSQTVELGSTEFAIESSTATNVTIEGLIVEKYASQTGEETIETWTSGWLIQNNEVRLNHGTGVGGRPGNENIKILNNYTHDNGQFGIGGGYLNGGTVSYNTIYHNNIDHTLSGFGAGGFKTGDSTNLLVSYNHVYDNLGNGLHADVNSNGVIFDHNTVYGNLGEGIRCEISNNCTITNNTVYGNVPNPNEPGTTVQIQVAYASSSNGIIENNTVVTSSSSAGIAGGIAVGYSTARGGCGTGCTIPVGMDVSNNTIYIAPGFVNALISMEDTSSPSTASSWEVAGMFDKNIYCVSSLPFTSANFWFGIAGTPLTSFSAWQGDGQDAHGSLSTTCPSSP